MKLLRRLAVPFLLLSFCAAAGAQEWRYAVRPGDTLIDIGQRYLARPDDWVRLQALNAVADPHRLMPGSRLRIPFALLRQGAAVATVIHVQGEAFREEGDQSLPLVSGDVLPPGATLRTGPGGLLSLRFVDGSRLLVARDSRLTLARMHQYGDTGMADTTIRLHQGDVDSRVPPRPDGPPRYRVESPVLNLGVRGTDFRLSVDAAGVARGEVRSGEVRATDGAGAHGQNLPAGIGAIARTGAAPEPRPLPPAPVLAGLPLRFEHLPLRFRWTGEGSAWRAQVLPAADDDRLLLDERFAAPEARWADLPDGDYRLRVRAVDAVGMEGFNAEHRFTVAARPEAPMPLGPGEGQRLREAEVTLRWAQPVGVSRYRLQIAERDDFANLLLEVAPERAEYRITLPLGRYVWRLASETDGGRVGPFGPPHAFTREDPPTSPALAESTVDDDALVLRWSAGQPGQTHHLQVARDLAFQQLVVDQQLSEPSHALSREEGGTYYVRLRTVDADGFAGPFGQVQQVEVPSSTTLWPLLLLPLIVLL